MLRHPHAGRGHARNPLPPLIGEACPAAGAAARASGWVRFRGGQPETGPDPSELFLGHNQPNPDCWPAPEAGMVAGEKHDSSYPDKDKLTWSCGDWGCSGQPRRDPAGAGQPQVRIPNAAIRFKSKFRPAPDCTMAGLRIAFAPRVADSFRPSACQSVAGPFADPVPRDAVGVFAIGSLARHVRQLLPRNDFSSGSRHDFRWQTSLPPLPRCPEGPGAGAAGAQELRQTRRLVAARLAAASSHPVSPAAAGPDG